MMWSTPVVVVTRVADLRPALSILNNRQRKYRYRLLAATVTNPARDILHESQREGEVQVQTGKQPEDDDERTQQEERT